MSTHKNARLTPYSREELVRRVLQEGTTVKDVAVAFGVSKTIAHKWIAHFRAEGADGLENRSPDPTGRVATSRSTPLVALQPCGSSGGPESGLQPNGGSRRPPWATHLRLLKLSRMKDLRPRPAIIRYERKISGEITHMDIKALQCFAKPGHRVTGRHTGMAHTPRAG